MHASDIHPVPGHSQWEVALVLETVLLVVATVHDSGSEV